MKGLIIFYVKFNGDEDDAEMKSTYDLIRSHNEELLATLETDGYKVMFVPTTKDACHAERVEFGD